LHFASVRALPKREKICGIKLYKVAGKEESPDKVRIKEREFNKFWRFGVCASSAARLDFYGK